MDELIMHTGTLNTGIFTFIFNLKSNSFGDHVSDNSPSGVQMMKVRMSLMISGMFIQLISTVAHRRQIKVAYKNRHHMFTLLFDGKLFLAPIPPNPQKVIDVGTGTGIWAM